MHLTKSFALLFILGGAAMGGAACSNDITPNPVPLPSASSASSGAGGMGGASTSTSTTTSTSTSGTGGAGGGMPAVKCLDAATYSGTFALKDASLCVVAKYTAPFVVGFDANFVEIAPSWGRHGGPLTLAQSGKNVTLTRWKLPAATTGALTVASTAGPIDTAINAQIAPAMLFMNAWAIDLPFNDWTAVGWADFGSPNGELILLAGSAIDARFPATGVFAAEGLSAGGKNRILTASLSALGASGMATGFYSADVCGKALCTMGTAQVQTQGDASGPVARDTAGNAFAVFPNLASKKQEIAAWAAAQIAPGAAAPKGETLATLDGSGVSIAAKAPNTTSAGYVLFQPAVMFVNQDVVALRYTVSAGKVAAMGSATAAIVPAKAGTEVRLLADDQGRLWAGIATGASESTFFVLERTPQ
jgi:hypothetical protein